MTLTSALRRRALLQPHTSASLLKNVEPPCEGTARHASKSELDDCFHSIFRRPTQSRLSATRATMSNYFRQLSLAHRGQRIAVACHVVRHHASASIRTCATNRKANSFNCGRTFNCAPNQAQNSDDYDEKI